MSMSHDEMIRRLGLKDQQDLKDLLSKYTTFVKGLSPAQQLVLKRSLPSVEEAAASFGPDVTADDLQKFFDEHCDRSGAMFSMYVAVVAPTHNPGN
jgi:hypothetical protein